MSVTQLHRSSVYRETSGGGPYQKLLRSQSNVYLVFFRFQAAGDALDGGN